MTDKEIIESIEKIESLIDAEYQTKDRLIPGNIVECYRLIEEIKKHYNENKEA